MGLEQVKDDVLQEAQQKADKINKEADKEAEEIREEARVEADKIRQEAEQEAESEADRLEKKELSKKRLEERKKTQNLKSEAVQEVFDDFREYLEEEVSEKCDEFVENVLEEVEFEVGTLVIPEDRDLETEFETDNSLDEEGVVVVSEDGSRQISYTVDRIVKEYRKNHRSEVAETLFQDDD